MFGTESTTEKTTNYECQGLLFQTLRQMRKVLLFGHLLLLNTIEKLGNDAPGKSNKNIRRNAISPSFDTLKGNCVLLQHLLSNVVVGSSRHVQDYQTKELRPP